MVCRRAPARLSKGGTRQEAVSGVLSVECDWFSVMGNFVRQQLINGKIFDEW